MVFFFPVLFFYLLPLYTHTHTHVTFLPLFPYVYYTFFVVDGHATFLALVFSLSFCVEVGFTPVDAGHCHNMTLQY